jgi:predicted dehydrogenase
VIVSLPPDKHFLGVKLAINNQKPVFIEASVVLEDVVNIQNYNKRNIFVAPSCTLFFHPLVKKIKEIVKSGKYGKITNFSYHSGQYLPDWHPWENVKDFYVSNRITGGAREIVPFELSWITDVIGIPQEIKGVFSKTINCEADIEDSYAFTMKYKNIAGVIIVDVASRYAIRNLVINLEEAQIQWRWDESKIKLYEAESKSWIEYTQPIFKSVAGYNENINENMYVEEITAFLKGIKDRSKYPNTIENDIKILQLLKDIEDSDGGFDR